MNINDVRGKLDILAANQQQLQWLRGLLKTDFAADVRNLDSALHRLQTTIQALLDIGAYVISGLNLPSPQDSADIITALRDAGLIDRDRRRLCAHGSFPKSRRASVQPH
jgi:uncharacterized protein YutE (UPF0331/DUF86 family)